MYEPGDIKILDPACPSTDEDGYCEETWTLENNHNHTLRDSRSDCKNWRNAAYLPHSCDEWIIGGEEEIKAMIRDLQEALQKLENVKGGEEQ